MSCGIYKITNKVNNHSYIGQSINIESRWTKEKSRAFNPNSEEYEKTLCRAFRKYGLFKGMYLSVKRVLKCHPFHPGGYDPLK